jgi:hypothetical protein
LSEKFHRRSLLGRTGGVALLSALSGWSGVAGSGRIAFVQQDGLWLRDLPAGQPRKIFGAGKVESPRFSASGDWISCFFEGSLCVISCEYGIQAKIDGSQLALAAPAAQWLPGRDELLVDGLEGLLLVRAANGWSNPFRTIRNARTPVLFGASGSEIVYADVVTSGKEPGGEPNRTGRLCRIAIDRAVDQPTVLFSKHQAALIPCAWSTTEKCVIYWENEEFSSSLAADGLALFRLPDTGGTPRSLGLGTLVHSDLAALSLKQDLLALSAGEGREEWVHERIALIHLKTGKVSYLTAANVAAVCPAWSPGGDRLAFTSAPASDGEASGKRLLEQRRIWSSGIGSNARLLQLTGDERYRDEQPLWSADGTHILFCRIDRSGQKSLWLMEAGGKAQVQVAGPIAAAQAWFEYYGYINWRSMFDWTGHRSG